MAKKFGKTEKHIQEEIEKAEEFIYQGKVYEVIKIGKPNPNDNKGEPKTDVYCLGKTSDDFEKEFKISVKQTDADFLENKISLERAIEIFGVDAQQIITKNIENIESKFQGKYIFIKKAGKTEKGAITIGWKFELLNVLSGKKSGGIELDDDQKIDIYAGTNIAKEKRNSKVNGEEIENSGIANYIIEVDKNALPSLDDIFENIRPIEEYAIGKDIYFACKAINFRTSKMAFENKPWDGNRPLAVYLDWELKDEKIIYSLVLNNPLGKKANEIGLNIKEILEHLNIDHNNLETITDHVSDKDIINI